MKNSPFYVCLIFFISFTHTWLSLFSPLLWFLLCLLHALICCCVFCMIQFPSFTGESQFLFLKPSALFMFCHAGGVKLWSWAHICSRVRLNRMCKDRKDDKMCEKCPACVKTSRSPRNYNSVIQFFLFPFSYTLLSLMFVFSHLFSHITPLVSSMEIKTTISLNTTNFLSR